MISIGLVAPPAFAPGRPSPQGRIPYDPSVRAENGRGSAWRRYAFVACILAFVFWLAVTAVLNMLLTSLDTVYERLRSLIAK